MQPHHGLPKGAVLRPPLWAVSKLARHKVVVTDTALPHADNDGDAHAIPWSDVGAVVPAEEGEGFLVVGRNLCAIDVHEDVYGRRAVEAVRERLPGDRWIRRPSPPADLAADVARTAVTVG